MPDPDVDNDFATPEGDQQRRLAALKEPGPSWRTWTFETGLKPYVLLLFLVLDAWIVLTWAEYGSAVGLFLTLVPAIYAELLLYRFLWVRPHPEEPRPFHRTWSRPVWAGRWTPEGARLRAGEMMPRPDESRKRDEFL